jgi:hypothetical protein
MWAAIELIIFGSTSSAGGGGGYVPTYYILGF